MKTKIAKNGIKTKNATLPLKTPFNRWKDNSLKPVLEHFRSADSWPFSAATSPWWTQTKHKPLRVAANCFQKQTQEAACIGRKANVCRWLLRAKIASTVPCICAGKSGTKGRRVTEDGRSKLSGLGALFHSTQHYLGRRFWTKVM